MARPLRIEFPNAFYHITSRGNELKDIYKDGQDRRKFLFYLAASTYRYKAIIHVYCLMSNHYHLLIETPLANLSQIMRYVNGSYTTYFNTRHNRHGHLLQGRYKAILIDADAYACELSRYIHLNPVRASIIENPGSYSWSSYLYYTGQKKIPGWLTTRFILTYFDREEHEARKRYSEFVSAMSDATKNDSPLKNAVASTILGGIDFVNEVKKKYFNDRIVNRDQPNLKEMLKGPSIDHIYKETRKVLGGNYGLAKKVTLYLSHNYSGIKLKEIGKFFGVGESAVSQSSSRVSALLKKDKVLREKIEQVYHEIICKM